MADLIFACVRGGSDAAPGTATVASDAGSPSDAGTPSDAGALGGATRLSAARLRRAALRLAPPGIEPRAPETAGCGGVVAVVANPVPGASRLRDGPAGGAAVGVFARHTPGWWRLGTEPPDGTGVVARWDEHTVELLSDAVASRTLWYVHDDGVLVASTSQRALVALLGGFVLDPTAVSWMLSAGFVGPDLSWDARLRRLPPDARLTLDRDTWRLHLRETPVVYEPAGGAGDEHVARLRETLVASCAALDLDLERWPLTLSGGVDSRTLLAAFLHLGTRPRCITWATRTAARDLFSDVRVARAVARRAGVRHDVLYLDPPPDGVSATVDRFVAAGEGLTDEIGGYVDGLAMWRDLVCARVHGVLRSDEACGTYAYNPATHENSRRGIVGAMVDDYPGDHLVRSLDLAAQSFPERLRARPGEDRLFYRVRMVHESWNPVRGAALTGIKARYVEVAEPHLSRHVLEIVRTLPVALLRMKRAVVAVSHDVAPLVPIARSSSTASMRDVLSSAGMVELMVRALTDPTVERVLAGDGALRVLGALVTPGNGEVPFTRRAKQVLKNASDLLPRPVMLRLKPPWRGPDPLPPSRLAFRVMLASRAIALFEDDAEALRGG